VLSSVNMATIKLCSWNVNGLKSVLNSCDGLDMFLDSLDSDIICIQETKLMFVRESRLCISKDFYSYFACNQSRDKMAKGYSGVATFVRKRADINCVAAQIGLTGMLRGEGEHRSDGQIVSITPQELLDLDITDGEALQVETEGRVVITDHGHFVLINAYAPYSPMEDVSRYNHKLHFNVMVRCVISKLHSAGRRVVLMGDLNVSAYPIDHCDPSDYYYPASVACDVDNLPASEMVRIRFADKPHVRWFRELIAPSEGEEQCDFLVDTFRAKHPQVDDWY
jgi:AP endonuclease 2